MVEVRNINDIEEFVRGQMLERIKAIKLLSTPLRVNDMQVATYPAEYKIEMGIEQFAKMFNVSDRIEQSERYLSDKLCEVEKRFTIFGVELVERRYECKEKCDE